MNNMQEQHLPTVFTFSIINEMQLRVIVLTKLDKTVNSVKDIF